MRTRKKKIFLHTIESRNTIRDWLMGCFDWLMIHSILSWLRVDRPSVSLNHRENFWYSVFRADWWWWSHDGTSLITFTAITSQSTTNNNTEHHSGRRKFQREETIRSCGYSYTEDRWITMSSLRNAVKRVAHKERSQPKSRQHLGLLEKKKDYKVRATDFHRKEDRIKAMRQKASMKNPDEFYLGGNNSKKVHKMENRKQKKRTTEMFGPRKWWNSWGLELGTKAKDNATPTRQREWRNLDTSL